MMNWNDDMDARASSRARPDGGRRLALAVAGAAGLAAVAWTAFGFFGIHTAFIDDRVAEAPPEFAVDGQTATPFSNARSGTFISRSHPTAGTALLLGDGAERVLRLEDFATDNGPDLKVYLVNASADAPDSSIAQDFVDLGRLKGNLGSQNYDIPSGTDLSVYRTVLIWCDRFSVSFGAAELG